MDEHLSVLLADDALESLPIIRGYFESIYPTNRGFSIHGWVLEPDQRGDSVRLYWNGELVEERSLLARPDVAAVLTTCPHAGTSGFALELPRSIFDLQASGMVDVVAVRDQEVLGRIRTYFRTDFSLEAVAPPSELIERVAGNPSKAFFLVGGMQAFGEFAASMFRHSDDTGVRRVLDWGCGPGRVTNEFSRHFANSIGVEIHGCDIDDEAIEWSRRHLPGEFSTISPWPPTPYHDGSFDVVLAYSVFTHLQKDDQAAWLKEVARLVRPGGLFLASAHGEFAARFVLGDGPESLPTGFSDGLPDARLDGIAPDGYYRAVFQTREYTESVWGEHFEIVDYLPRGMGSFQDLIVMRRP